MSRRHTYKWIQRCVQEGLERLEEKPGRERRRGLLPPSLSEEPHTRDVG